jgi:hypothetical protein
MDAILYVRLCLIVCLRWGGIGVTIQHDSFGVKFTAHQRQGRIWSATSNSFLTHESLEELLTQVRQGVQCAETLQVMLPFGKSEDEVLFMESAMQAPTNNVAAWLTHYQRVATRCIGLASEDCPIWIDRNGNGVSIKIYARGGCVWNFNNDSQIKESDIPLFDSYAMAMAILRIKEATQRGWTSVRREPASV